MQVMHRPKRQVSGAAARSMAKAAENGRTATIAEIKRMTQEADQRRIDEIDADIAYRYGLDVSTVKQIIANMEDVFNRGRLMRLRAVFTPMLSDIRPKGRDAARRRKWAMHHIQADN